MLTLVLSCDEPGCAARHEMAVHAVNTTYGLAVAGYEVADGWQRLGLRTVGSELRCPEHAGAAT